MRNVADISLAEFAEELKRLNNNVINFTPSSRTWADAKSTRSYANQKRGQRIGYKVVSLDYVRRVRKELTT